MWYGVCADGLVAIHVAYIAFVLGGQLAIFAGLVLHWRWIRNLWFRAAHLLAILIVVFEALFGITCPLTDWEYQLRVLAGQEPSGETFIGRILHSMIFFPAPLWLYTTLYVGFGLLVLTTFFLAPPRWRKQLASP